MKRAIGLLALTIGLSALATEAMATGAAARIIGQGTQKCWTWTLGRKVKHAEQYEQWALGFMSGMALTITSVKGSADGSTDFLSGTDAQAIWRKIDRQCLLKPHEQLEEAVVAVVGELQK